MKSTFASVLVILFVLSFSAVYGQQCLKSCDSALESVFAAAQAYQCVQLTISSLSSGSSSVSYTQGNIYFNIYYDGLVNWDIPSFPIISNRNVACTSGVNQPFSAQSVSSHVAAVPFDVLVTRAGVLRLAVGPQVFVNITLACSNNGQFPAMGYDDQGNAYAAQFTVLSLPAGCPSDVIGTSCNSTASAATACFPPCGTNQSCVFDSGYGSCVASSTR